MGRLPIPPLMHLFGGVEENRTLYRKGANLPRYLSTCYPILFGAKGWDRTTDTRLRRPLLFHLSYSRKVVQGTGIEPVSMTFQAITNPSQLTLHNTYKIGRCRRIRTFDFIAPNDAL